MAKPVSEPVFWGEFSKYHNGQEVKIAEQIVAWAKGRARVTVRFVGADAVNKSCEVVGPDDKLIIKIWTMHKPGEGDIEVSFRNYKRSFPDNVLFADPALRQTFLDMLLDIPVEPYDAAKPLTIDNRRNIKIAPLGNNHGTQQFIGALEWVVQQM